MKERWGRLGSGGRVAVVVVGVLGGINLFTRVLGSTIGGGEPGGPPASSYATAADGVAAWATLLDEHGHDVTKVRSRLDRVVLPPGSTIVLADPRVIEDAERATVASFVLSGGRLVVTGERGAEVADDLVPDLRWVPGGETTAALDDIPDVGRARELRTARGGRWRDDGVLVAADVGGGRVVALADTSPLTNDLLDEADNAALGLAIVGDGPVHFAEAAHGYGTDGFGFDDLPPGWTTTLIGAALVAAAFLWSRARRFGPPNHEEPVPPPPRRAYVDAMAASTIRAGSADEALEPLRAHARERLARRAGVDAAVGDAELRGAAARAGVDESLVAAVIHGSALDLGRAAANLEEAHP